MTQQERKTMSAHDRFHRKSDGILWIRADGSARFLMLWERMKFAFGWRPQ